VSPRQGGRRTAILAGGTAVYTSALQAAVAGCALVIAADGGLRHALAVGARPALLIGDLDSVAAGDIASFPGIEIVKHPAEKDEIDTELAVAEALARGAVDLLLVGGTGDRWDHSLTNLALAARLAGEGTACELTDGVWRIVMVAPELPWTGDLEAGDEVGLVPVAGDVTGVTTSGVEYPLREATLRYGAGRGASNRATGGPVQVACQDGTIALTLRPVGLSGR
jgi:thiamine pyrophosphokinase